MEWLDWILTHNGFILEAIVMTGVIIWIGIRI